MLMEYDDKDKPTGDWMTFQYFPETLTDTKAINYATREIPGGSLPLYQWISSGERILSFTALFTTDVDLLVDPASFLKIKQNGQIRRNVDVRTALLWLRQYMLPRYTGDGGLGVPLTQAPRKVFLSLHNSGLGLLGGELSAKVNVKQGTTEENFSFTTEDSLVHPDGFIAIMTQCDITFEAFFPTGLPRIASVQVQFAQTAQLAGSVNFPRMGAGLSRVIKEGKNVDQGVIKSKFFPYNMKIKIS